MTARADVPGPPAPRALPTRFDDPELERALRELRERLDKVAAAAGTAARVIADQELEDGVETPIAHGLGRAATWVRESCVRGAASSGRVEWVQSATYDADKYVVLKATGFGATITCSVAVL